MATPFWAGSSVFAPLIVFTGGVVVCGGGAWAFVSWMHRAGFSFYTRAAVDIALIALGMTLNSMLREPAARAQEEPEGARASQLARWRLVGWRLGTCLYVMATIALLEGAIFNAAKTAYDAAAQSLS